MIEVCNLSETALMVRADWPSTICPVAGLHRWAEGPEALYCDRCGQWIAYTECAAYQKWAFYWINKVMQNTVSVLN